MNKHFKYLLLLLVATAALPLMLRAYQLPSFLIINAGLGKQFGLKIEGLIDNHADFTVKSARGKILLQHEIEGNSYQGLYSLEYLQEGNYFFILKTEKGEIRQPVRLTQRAIRYELSERKMILSPEVRQKGRQLDIDFQNPDKEDFTIKLLDASEKILYQETINDLEEIEKRLNLLRIPSGTYYLEMRTPSARWMEVLKLR